MKVLLVRDEYSTDIYDASTKEKLYDVAYRLVQERLEQGYYISTLPEEPKKPFTDEELVSLPTSLRFEANSQMYAYRRSLLSFYSEKKEFDMVELVKRGDKSAAWVLLQSHADSENEYVELKEVLD